MAIHLQKHFKITVTQQLSSMMVTHFTDIYGLLIKRLEDVGMSQRFKSYVMTTQLNKDGTVDYFYKLTEAPPPKSSHARAVVSKRGVTQRENCGA
jgi:hypothetical protein